MCVGAPIIAETSTILNTGAVPDLQAIDEILTQAIRAGEEASNRAMKRRVRQRLHKKLGSMLSKEDFEAAMERFKLMEDNGIEAVAKPYLNIRPMPQICGFAVPVFVPMANLRPAVPFAVMNCESKAQNQGVVAGVAASDTTGLDDLEELSDLESVSHCWERALRTHGGISLFGNSFLHLHASSRDNWNVENSTLRGPATGRTNLHPLRHQVASPSPSFSLSLGDHVLFATAICLI
eukprot:symbB.v1.2.030048.t1/scaffold3346.1/size69245/3